MEYNDIILYQENYVKIKSKIFHNNFDYNRIDYNKIDYNYNINKFDDNDYNIFFDFIHLTKNYKNENLDNNKDKLNNLINSLSIIISNNYSIIKNNTQLKLKLKLNLFLSYIKSNFNKIRFLNYIFLSFLIDDNNIDSLFNDKFILNFDNIKETFFNINENIDEIINIDINNLSTNDFIKYYNNSIFFINYNKNLSFTSLKNKIEYYKNYSNILKLYLIIIYKNNENIIKKLINKIKDKKKEDIYYYYNTILYYTNILFYFDYMKDI